MITLTFQEAELRALLVCLKRSMARDPEISIGMKVEERIHKELDNFEKSLIPIKQLELGQFYREVLLDYQGNQELSSAGDNYCEVFVINRDEKYLWVYLWGFSTKDPRVTDYLKSLTTPRLEKGLYSTIIPEIPSNIEWYDEHLICYEITGDKKVNNEYVGDLGFLKLNS